MATKKISEFTAASPAALSDGDDLLITRSGSSFKATFDSDATIVDSSGNELVIYSGIASAVNEFTITSGATGSAPELSATGDDTNIDLTLAPKGTGNVTMLNCGIKLFDNEGILDNSSNEHLIFQKTTDAVNHLEITNAATGNSPILGAAGDDAAVSITLTPKGTGDLVLSSGSIQIADAEGVHDSNGNEQLIFQETASAVNYMEITNSATTNAPQLASVGDDTNIDFTIAPKGTGNLTVLNAGIKLADAEGILDDGGNEHLVFQKTASAVNEFEMTNAATGNSPQLAVTGDDTNIDLTLTPKGTGVVIADSGVSFDSGTTTLDTYEEGTWTPVLEGESTAGTQTYASNVGAYTRIGRMVFATFRMDLSALDGATAGNMKITGLPYTVKNQNANRPGVAWSEVANLTCTSILPLGAVQTNTTEIHLWETSSGGNSARLVAGDFANGTRLRGSFTYPV